MQCGGQLLNFTTQQAQRDSRISWLLRAFHGRLQHSIQPYATLQVDPAIVVGSGHLGRSYLALRGGSIWQTGLTWYPAAQIWDLSPGFKPGIHARRTVMEPVVTARLPTESTILPRISPPPAVTAPLAAGVCAERRSVVRASVTRSRLQGSTPVRMRRFDGVRRLDIVRPMRNVKASVRFRRRLRNERMSRSSHFSRSWLAPDSECTA